MTDKKTEALKLALDVLTPDPEEAFWFVEKKKEKAITAIREALADSALDRMAENARDLGLDYEPPCKTGSQCTNKFQQCEQPAQQQEHVSVMTVLHLKDRTEIGYGPASAGYDLPTGEYKLYTSPPASKPWVGLTEEEIHKMTVLMGINPEWKAEIEIVRSIVRNLEAKLKEKNA